MALGRQRERQTEMLVSWSEMVRSPGHAFYDKLQVVLTLIVARQANRERGERRPVYSRTNATNRRC